MFYHFFYLQDFLAAFVVLFAIIDILGATPIVLKLRQQGRLVSPLRASVMTLFIFTAFLFVGEAFLKLFSLDISSFAVAGSVILFILALEMILDIQIFRDSPDLPKDATFTPVVFPLIVGAGSLTTLLSLRAQYHVLNIILAVLANAVIIYLVLRSAKSLEKFLGPGVLYIIQKMFGIILLALAVKLFITNVSILIQNL